MKQFFQPGKSLTDAGFYCIARDPGHPGYFSVLISIKVMEEHGFPLGFRDFSKGVRQEQRVFRSMRIAGGICGLQSFYAFQ